MIVDGVTLDVAPGKTLSLLGRNGSGKSSLLRLICGLRRVSSGVLTLGDTDVTALPRGAIARRVALVEQQAAHRRATDGARCRAPRPDTASRAPVALGLGR